MTITIDPLVRQVKSRLLPLSLVESFLERLVEKLPRTIIKFALTPSEYIVVLDENKGEFRADDNMPSFEMVFAASAPKSGWFYLEAALVHHNGNREANIRADLLGAHNSNLIIPIPTNLRGTVREVFYLPSDLGKLIWQPTAAPGFFSQSPLLLHKITWLESTLRRMDRVLFDLWRFRGRLPETRAGLTLRGAIGNLQDAYQRTAKIRLARCKGFDYQAFIALNDTPDKADIRAMGNLVYQMPRHPVITLITPVHSPKVALFTEILDSVIGQIYPNWELVLVGDFSVDTESKVVADDCRGKDVRVKFVSVDSDVGLATSLNRAVDMAKGEFIAVINQYDIIPSHALSFLAKEINNYPDVDLIYSDHDSMDEAHQRSNPHFKPDWNPDLLFSYHYLSNLTLYRLARVKEIGGFHSGFNGAENYELSLRFTRDLATDKIKHIPKILYHTLTVKSLVAESTTPEHSKNTKSEELAHNSGKKALMAYFEGSGAIVENGVALGLYRIQYPLPKQQPLVSIIIPTRDQVEILKNCIGSIQQKTSYRNWEMLVIDNQSVKPETHAYFEQIQADSRIKVISYNKPFNYSALNNYAVQQCKGEVLALVNNDVEVITTDWLSELVSHAIRPGIGAVGAKLLYSNGRVQHAGVIVGLGGVAGHAHRYLKRDEYGYCYRAVVTQNLTAVTAACLVVKKTSYHQVGGLNERDLIVAFNDIDFCLKLVDAGYRNVFAPHATLYHHESISRGRDDTPAKHALFEREFAYMKFKWGNKLRHDRAYNPNLSLEFEDYSLSLIKSVWLN